tara:strand:+ start:359 stop:562 length:204 start_codon:yes stop_codon:yes gene_type:complete
MIEYIIVALVSGAIGISIGTFLQMKETKKVKIQAAMAMIILVKNKGSKEAKELEKAMEGFIVEEEDK